MKRLSVKKCKITISIEFFLFIKVVEYQHKNFLWIRKYLIIHAQLYLSVLQKNRERPLNKNSIEDYLSSN